MAQRIYNTSQLCIRQRVEEVIQIFAARFDPIVLQAACRLTKQDLAILHAVNWCVLQAAVEEKARVAKEKELETARLRAKQERAADRQAEIDELRARRSPFLPASHSLPPLLLLPIGKTSIPSKDVRKFPVLPQKCKSYTVPTSSASSEMQVM